MFEHHVDAAAVLTARTVGLRLPYQGYVLSLIYYRSRLETKCWKLTMQSSMNAELLAHRFDILKFVHIQL